MTKSFLPVTRALALQRLWSSGIGRESMPALPQDHDDMTGHMIVDNHKIVSTYVQNFHVFSGIFLRRMVDNGTAAVDILAMPSLISGRTSGNRIAPLLTSFADYQFSSIRPSVDGSVTPLPTARFATGTTCRN